MDFQRQTAILATTVEDTLNLSKSITEYGIMITISAVFLILTLFIFKRMINSYSKTIDGIIPKLEETSKSINALKISINELMSAHNAHSNQSLRTLERDMKDVKEDISHYQKALIDLDRSLNVLQENYNTLLKIIIHNNGYNRIVIPEQFIDDHYDDRMVHVDPTHYREHLDDVGETNKKEGDES